MTEQQIKRAKRLAEILKLPMVNPELSDCTLYFTGGVVARFNPEQDKSLLWDLQIKYKPIIDWWNDRAGFCYIESKEFTRECSFDFDGVADLPAALIDCVIEINGGYDE